MADQKVSDLPSLNGADVDPADLLYIVDSSAGTAGSKKITVGQFQIAPFSGSTADTVLYLNGSKVLSSSSALTFDGTNFATTGTATATKFIPTGNVTAGNGMYLPAANNLAWSINGSEQMRLTSTGLGIGTSSPTTKLYVTVSAANTACAAFFNTDTANGNGLYVKAGGANSGKYALAVENAAGTSLAYLDSSGNLGLGVTPPTGSNQAGIFLSGTNNVFGGAGNGASFTSNVYNSSGTWKYATSSFATLYQQTSGQHVFYTAASGTATNNISWTQAMTLDASGRLGIGLTNPAYRLDVEISAGPYVARFRNSSTSTSEYNVALFGQGAAGAATGYIGTGGSAVGNASFANTFVVGTQTSNALVFNTTDTERARITSGGYFKASNAGTYAGGATSAAHEFDQNSTSLASLYVYSTANATGNYGINVGYPNRTPNDTGNEFLICGDSTATRATIRSNGGLANYSGNNVNLSDRREKTNFAPAKSYLDTICAIPVQTFNYIDQSPDDPGLTLGVVAQDVQAVAPELVMESNWGTEDNPKMRLSIYQTDLQYALMKCVQELKAQNDELRARVAALEAKP